MGNDGIFISETEPNVIGNTTWLRILPDSGREWYEKVEGVWTLVRTEPAPAIAGHTHDNLDHLADIVALLASGVSGTKTLGGHTLTFDHGVLTGFEVA